MSQKKYSLVICAIFQDEALFLKEWIEFHKLIGVQHFYLYNNSSTDESAQILEPYILAKEVELFDWPGQAVDQNDYIMTKQVPAYNHALSLTQETSQWAAFIDLDEFIVPVKKDNLVDLLADYQEYAGLLVNWQVYGTSDVLDLDPQELLTESLVWKAKEDRGMNEMTKFIVQPSLIEQIDGPHFFTQKENYSVVDSHKNPVSKVWRHPVQIDVIRLNHYWFGTHNWFLNKKIPRHARWKVEFPEKLLPPLFNSFNQVKDESICKYAPLLRQKMFGKANDEDKMG